MPTEKHPTSLDILIIENSGQLQLMVEKLNTKNAISFDTEYDSFRREYGFKLLLMQIYDGENVYIIDPLKLSEMSPLWTILENPDIPKIVYSGSEDIALMKQFGCQVRNIFDVQIAATLCNHPARNLGDLIESSTGEPVDKSQQKSDWRGRPLTPEQVQYAANDVIHLIELKKTLSVEVDARELMHALNEENVALENVHEREHIPKLKPSHYKYFPQSYCDALLAMVILRDQIARQLNLPPVRVVDTRYLEEALNMSKKFLSVQEFKSFHPKIRNNIDLKNKFIKILEAYDPADLTMQTFERSADWVSTKSTYSKEEQQRLIIEKYEPIKTETIAKYGELTAEYLLRGLKKEMFAPRGTTKELKQYQMVLLERIRVGME